MIAFGVAGTMGQVGACQETVNCRSNSREQVLNGEQMCTRKAKVKLNVGGVVCFFFSSVQLCNT